MNVEPGLVTTVIPVFNRARAVGEAVDSVLAQSWRPIEIIIVDDGSTDDTPAKLYSLQAAHPDLITIHHQANAGPGPAREAGLAVARGEFVQFLDSDDLLLPGKFAAQVAGLQRDPGTDISYGLCLMRQAGKPDVPTHGTDTEHIELFPAVLKGRIWPTLAPLYRRSLCRRVGAWSQLRVLEDWDYDCRAGLLGVRLHYVEHPVGVVRRGRDDHAGLAWMASPQVMRDRGEAYARVAGYAREAGLDSRLPEVRQLVRSLFWMARNMAACGLEFESRRLFGLARSMAVDGRAQYVAYALFARFAGWARTARWSQRLSRRA
jgi:glycosyltransferase involved in cell wall biosynthesis